MSSPKHLWSGDWESESDALAQPPAAPLVTPAPTADTPEPPSGRGARKRRRGLVGAAVLVLVLIVGIVLAFALGSSSQSSPAKASAQVPSVQSSPGANNSGGAPLAPPSQPAPQTTTTPQPTTTQAAAAPVVIGPIYDWLGMQLSDSDLGPTVGTVLENSASDQAGVDPGDVIAQINTTPVDSVAQLRSAVAHLKLGQRFQLTVERGSTPVTLTARLTGRPTKVS